MESFILISLYIGVVWIIMLAVNEVIHIFNPNFSLTLLQVTCILFVISIVIDLIKLLF